MPALLQDDEAGRRASTDGAVASLHLPRSLPRHDAVDEDPGTVRLVLVGI